MPRGLIGTLAICTVLYVLVCIVLVGMVKYTDLSEGAPISDAFEQVGLGWASILVGVAAVAGLTSVMLVELVTVGRIGFALSRDGLLPKAIGAIHPTWHTPWRATGLVVVLVMALSGFVPIGTLAEMVSIGTLFAFFVVSVAVIILRRTRPRLERPFKVPQVPLVPGLSAILCVALMTNLAVETWLRFLVWLAIGMAIYFGYGRKHSALGKGATARR
jgi:APA family basic amino acid/polyamine antiporter